MRIEFDYDVAEDGVIVGRHYIDTDDVQSMAVLKRLSTGAQKIEGTGWEEMTHHPSYHTQTRLHAVLEELKLKGVAL